MACTGTPEVNPIKFGAPAIDYATGTMGAFALSAALFQREKTGRGQHIDLAMMDVAMMMMASHVTSYGRSGKPARPRGNDHEYSTNSCYQTADGLVMIGASNLRQQRRLWQALGRPDMAKESNEARHADRAHEAATLAELLKAKTADEWESYLQARHVPAARVRNLAESLADPQIKGRGVVHHFDAAPGVTGPFSVPVAAFGFAHGGPRVDTPPPQLGRDNDAISWLRLAMMMPHATNSAPLARFETKGKTMTQFTFDHIHLRSPDPEATAVFYERMFGAEVLRSTPAG
jgi:crotonobetainyl-CoA:carnitine CoA-transferase CaiB-like acyl-CoA transferase